MCVYNMGNLRIVDLTKQLDPQDGDQKMSSVSFQYRRPYSGFPHHYGFDQPSGNSLRMPVSS